MIAVDAMTTTKLAVACTNVNTHVCAHRHSVNAELQCLKLITTTQCNHFEIGLPDNNSQTQQGRCAQHSFVRLIFCPGLQTVARTGTPVIVW